ncbi:MAG: TraB/GumN family protein [Candidatus Delongbacteria bacterium]|nr:TraB/GumN family protein [Candidatus Delongbacteria bacterium]
MKRIIILLLVAVFYLSAANDIGMFWKVKDSKGNDKVYLLGSIHVVPDDLYPLKKDIEVAFKASNYLVVEADVANIDMAKVQQLTMQHGMYSAGKDLKSAIPEDLYVKLAEELKKTGMFTIDLAAAMKPWLISLTLAQLQLMQMGLNMENGIDMHFLKLAKDKKEILELESAEFQIELLSSFSDELQIEFLKSAVEESPNMKEKFDNMLDAWRKGDTKKMVKVIKEEYKDKPKLQPIYDKLIYDRNVTMTDKIEGYLKDKSDKKYFVVVGAGHLVDKGGIVNLLNKKGFKAEKK